VRYRLAKAAEDALVSIRIESIRQWGKVVANRYDRLLDQAIEGIAENPFALGSREIPRPPGIKVYHIKNSRHHVEREDRIGSPRHLIIYRVASDGVVEILGIIYDRMLLRRAANRLTKDAVF
jgi:toxin ParE1/3/4